MLNSLVVNNLAMPLLIWRLVSSLSRYSCRNPGGASTTNLLVALLMKYSVQTRLVSVLNLSSILHHHHHHHLVRCRVSILMNGTCRFALDTSAAVLTKLSAILPSVEFGLPCHVLSIHPQARTDLEIVLLVGRSFSLICSRLYISLHLHSI